MEISNNYINEIKTILKNARQKAYTAVNSAMVEAYWKIGRRIVEEEQSGRERAEYGKEIIKNLSKELTEEFGKGFAFVERQQHIRTENSDFYIDLVFYNYILKCFVIVELKTGKLTHQDIGQLDMYVRMYDDLKKQENDNPTIGLLLCTDTDSTVIKYSVLNDNKNLFASKYVNYLPSEEELINEIERQKILFEINNEVDL